MIPEIKIIHQLSLNEIFKVKISTESDLKAWVANGHYLITDVLVPSVKDRATSFELRFQKSEILHASIANDCNRFSQAAIESMWTVSKVDKLPRSTGWASVQMYYSAFFAAHALLRIFGQACSQLEIGHVDKVFQIASATQQDGGISRIENGFYFSSISNNKISFNKLNDSHSDTWSSFSKLLLWLIENIPNTYGIGRHKLDAITLISNIKLALHKSGATKGNWPSQIRNKINYQHTYGVWYPYKDALHDHKMLLRNNEWIKDPKTFDLFGNTNDISTLYNLSNSILSLMHHLMRYGYERSEKVSLPFSKGTFRLLNQLHLSQG